MKKMIFLTLTLLSLFNVEAFAAQPQSAKPTSSWLSWAPLAGAAGALVGTGMGYHLYKKYSERYEREFDDLQSQGIDDQERKQKEEVDYYAKQIDSIKNLKNDALKLENSEANKEELAKSISTQIRNFNDSDGKPKIKHDYCIYDVLRHSERCEICNPSLFVQRNLHNYVRVDLDNFWHYPARKACESIPSIQPLIESTEKALIVNKTLRNVAADELTRIQAEQNKVHALQIKKTIAKRATYCYGSAFLGITGLGIYNWWNRK